MAIAAAKGRTEKTLEHAEATLGLPTLPVLRDGPMVLEQLTEEPSRPFSLCLRGTTTPGRNYPKHPELVIKEPMMMLGIVAGVGQQCLEGMSPMGLSGKTVQLNVVRLGPPVNDRTQKQVASRVGYRGQFRVSMVLTSAASAEVRRGV